MSELLDKEVYVLNECLNINSGIHAGGHASPRKVCDENKMLNKNSLAVKKVRGQSEATMAISDQNL